MKFGVCFGAKTDTIEMMLAYKDIGYDYIETSVPSILSMTDEELKTFSRDIQANDVEIYSANMMFPNQALKREIHLVGPKIDPVWENTYLQMLLERCQAIGLKVLVLGSGNTRIIPDGYPKEKAFEEYVSLCIRAGDIAAKHNVTIVIEPLEYNATNFVNTLEDGYEIVRAANHPSIKLLADFYHVTKNNESLCYSDALLDTIYHVHWAEQLTRTRPGSITTEMTQFASALKSRGYNSTISLECSDTDDVEGMKQSLQILKRIF